VYVESRITVVDVSAFRMRLVASIPLIPGKLMSINTSRGWCSAASSIASSPLSASATTLNPEASATTVRATDRNGA
jgi:hypothetical protein